MDGGAARSCIGYFLTGSVPAHINSTSYVMDVIAAHVSAVTAVIRANDIILHGNMRNHTTGAFHLMDSDTHRETKRTNEENDFHFNSRITYKNYYVSEKKHENELRSDSKRTGAITPLQNEIDVEAGSEGHVSDAFCIPTHEPIYPLCRVQFRSPRAYVPREFKMLPEKDRCKQRQSSESIIHQKASAIVIHIIRLIKQGIYTAIQDKLLPLSVGQAWTRTKKRSTMFPIQKIRLNGLSTGTANPKTDTLH
ncbi:hypothetical protein DPMN_143817 [Dreissena polymorpha]|uniref:Uncharacterized protein n=1 Tax=Dreissena polymorpha TaxID=45954 RepID=A0A9D4GHR5_DREPO|nr:hypothetical protein DPMN_143817 [Dreissena polymorpha]